MCKLTFGKHARFKTKLSHFNDVFKPQKTKMFDICQSLTCFFHV
jgi:hypothetical protein